jgi:Activator of Hsp90 ATPase homolog 1-like protein
MTLKPINKQITIKATPVKIWNVLLSKETYLQWAKVFMEGTTYDTENNFEKGGKVIFGDGTGNGLVAMVSINEPNYKIQFTYTGEISEGVEKSAGSFDGATETYTLTQNGEEVLLTVETSMMDEWYDSMDKAWDQAIIIIKELSEN